MAEVPDDDGARRQPLRHSVVPEAAGRSLWLSAVWTGAGVAVVCATLALVAVAVCWLPVSGSGHHASATIKAGLLSFLAALHAGVTIDGTAAAWVPLGMTLIVAAVAWRAGSGLADAAAVLGESDPVRLWLAGAAQAGAFALCCLVAVPLASLGTSRAPFLGVGAAALLLFAASGVLAFVLSSPLRDWCATRIPAVVAGAVRPAAAAVTVYVGGGAALVAAALLAHHDAVTTISRQVGGGWGAVPVLLLCVLAAPNAAIAAASYVAGPGFAVGTGTTVSVATTANGTLPAFPVLGALPSGHGATWPAWALVIAVALLAAAAAARLAHRAATWAGRLQRAGAAALVSGLGMLVLAWLGGGAIGTGRLHVVGASPWQVGGAVTLEVGALSLAWLGLGAAWTWLRRPIDDDDEVGFFLSAKPADAPADGALRVVTERVEEVDGSSQLAG